MGDSLSFILIRNRRQEFYTPIRKLETTYKNSFCAGWLLKNSVRRLRWIAAVPVTIAVSACGNLIPRDDYPSAYPAAPMTGTCPDLSGTFENAGTRLGKTTVPSEPIWLSSLLLGPEVAPPGPQVSRVQIRGPAQGTLQIEALTADGAVAHSSMPIEAKADGFIHSKPYAAFLCDFYQGGGDVVVTNEPVTASGTKYEVAVRIYRAKDGSLVVAREEDHTDFLGQVDVWRKWYRFQQAPTNP